MTAPKPARGPVAAILRFGLLRTLLVAAWFLCLYAAVSGFISGQEADAWGAAIDGVVFTVALALQCHFMPRKDTHA